MSEAVSLSETVMDCEMSFRQGQVVVVPADRYCLGIGVAEKGIRSQCFFEIENELTFLSILTSLRLISSVCRSIATLSKSS